MAERFEKYAEIQKRFWNVEDAGTAKFERIDTEQDKTEEAWKRLADQDATRVLDGITIGPDFTLLEVGCGIGRIIDKLRERVQFKRYIGVDISEKMIEFAKEYLGNDTRISLAVNNGYDLACVESDVADFAYSVDVFIHIYDVDIAANYLSEVYRALKKGKKFRFNVRRWNIDNAFGNSIGGRIAKLTYKLRFRSSGGHTWRPGDEAGFNGNQYTPSELKELVARTDFQLLEMKVLDSVIWCTLEKPA